MANTIGDGFKQGMMDIKSTFCEGDIWYGMGMFGLSIVATVGLVVVTSFVMDRLDIDTSDHMHVHHHYD